MIKSFFFISLSGEPIIEKHWRGIASRSLCDEFWDEVNKHESKEDVPPIICASKYFLISICIDGYFLLAVTSNESAPLLVIELLHRIYATFQEYFGTVDEGTIKDHFCTVYQLLEEMIDYGYALTTEPNALKAMIEPPSVMSMITQFSTGKSTISDVLPDGTLSNTPWRTLGLKYSQNEVYLDIIEEVDATVDCSGSMVSEVSGSIECNCHMTGMPDLNLEFTNPSVIDDCSFHPCVRYNRYEKNKLVSFVPPDGHFQLMRYRVTNTAPVVLPCYCQPQFHSYNKSDGECQINILVGLTATHSLIYPSQKGPMELEDVEILIPFGKLVKTANLKATVGTIVFEESTKVARWIIGKLVREKQTCLSGTVLFNKSSKKAGSSSGGGGGGKQCVTYEDTDTPHVQMHWKVPMASISGLAVAALELMNENYKPYKGVRTLTKSGKVLIRSS